MSTQDEQALAEQLKSAEEHNERLHVMVDGLAAVARTISEACRLASQHWRGLEAFVRAAREQP